MATYKALKGFKVKSLSSDPTTDLGQLWYNTTSNTLKFDGVGAGAWGSMPSCNTARDSAGSLGGTPYTGVVLMGGEPAPAGIKTETYNGTAWTEVADMPATRSISIAAGTNTAGLVAAGPPGTTDLWNGTSWSAGSGTAPVIGVTAWTGATTSDVMGAGGFGPASTNTSLVYNGTSWSAGGTMSRAAFYGGNGATAAPGSTALVFGGLLYPPVNTTAATELYNGTGWSTVEDVNTKRYYAGSCGTSTAAMFVAGNNFPTALTIVEQYDGTTWTEVGDIATATTNKCSSGGTTAAIAATGSVTGGRTLVCEEWDGAPFGVQTVTVS